MARDWRTFWNDAPLVRDSDPLVQVGKTVGGASVSIDFVSLIANSIRTALKLELGDAVLELCCGNGLITFEIAKICAKITGIDFSEPLIATARQRYARRNICYIVEDVTALSKQGAEGDFDKIFMHEALQHFAPDQVDNLLARLARSASRNAPIFFGSIPDAERLRNFYNTPKRYHQYLENVRQGVEPIGTWWWQDNLIGLVEKRGYRATVLKQDSRLHTAHYRFDLLCEPN
jgi:cyclopropane fatty-acyl-phospholipid synthase-like methyltransferase